MLPGARSRFASFHHRRGARRQAFAGAANAGALRRRARERVRAAVRRGLRAGHAARARSAGPRLRSRGHEARRLRDHVGGVRRVHQIAVTTTISYPIRLKDDKILSSFGIRVLPRLNSEIEQ